MCIAVPMQITEIDNETNSAKAIFSGNEITINTTLVSPQLGDYVLVHAGCAIEIVKKETAMEILDIFNDLEEITR